MEWVWPPQTSMIDHDCVTVLRNGVGELPHCGRITVFIEEFHGELSSSNSCISSR